MKKSFSQFQPGTPAYVILHGRHMLSRGRNLSATLGKQLNPRLAFAKALEKSREYKILPGGWLFHIIPGLDSIEFYALALRKSDQGKDPGYYDNSEFTRVDPKYAGQVAYAFPTGGHRLPLLGEPKQVTLTNGKIVAAETSRPLAYEKWGKVMPASPSVPFFWNDFGDDDEWMYGW